MGKAFFERSRLVQLLEEPLCGREHLLLLAALHPGASAADATLELGRELQALRRRGAFGPKKVGSVQAEVEA